MDNLEKIKSKMMSKPNLSSQKVVGVHLSKSKHHKKSKSKHSHTDDVDSLKSHSKKSASMAPEEDDEDDKPTASKKSASMAPEEDDEDDKPTVSKKSASMATEEDGEDGDESKESNKSASMATEEDGEDGDESKESNKSASMATEEDGEDGDESKESKKTEDTNTDLATRAVDDVEELKESIKEPVVTDSESDDDEETEPETEDFDANGFMERLQQNNKAKRVVDDIIKSPKLSVIKKLRGSKDKMKKKRLSEKVSKHGALELGPEIQVQFDENKLLKKMHPQEPLVNIRAPSYYMNNREIFINFINSLFEPYKKELEQSESTMTCENMGNASKNGFTLLTHQKIVRDYINLYTPYRGLLLYHGLGSGKTCSAIGIAEGMKNTKQIIMMTPASLKANTVEELKKCGDYLYRRNQFWEWVPAIHEDEVKALSSVLNLSKHFIEKHKGAWFVNYKKKTNYAELGDAEKVQLEAQLDEMINAKYKFINYNGIRTQKLYEMTKGHTINIFDNCVVIIDEAHNLVSRIVNKIKMQSQKEQEENKRGEKIMPLSMSLKFYEMLMSAKNAKIIMLSGTPVINYPNEFGILFNILRGYIKTWRIPIVVNTSKRIDTTALREILKPVSDIDYFEYSPSSKILTITRNPFGFKNKYKSGEYSGVSNNKKIEKLKSRLKIDDDEDDDKRVLPTVNEYVINTDVMDDDEFEQQITQILKDNNIIVQAEGIRIQNKKALPDTYDAFEANYIDPINKNLRNIDAIKRRIVGLTSYFKTAQENLMPRYNKVLGVDYHVVSIPMSNFQFKLYEQARKKERKMERGSGNSKQPAQGALKEIYTNTSSTYRIFSRMICDYAVPDRPYLEQFIVKRAENDDGEGEGEDKYKKMMAEADKIANEQDINGEETEMEGDEVLNKLGGKLYKEMIHKKIQEMQNDPEAYFSPKALQTYSPKFLAIMENIKEFEYAGCHLVYSQFRTFEGIQLLSDTLSANGFVEFKLKRTNHGKWDVSFSEKDWNKPKFALYTGTESKEEKDLILAIYNGFWDKIPDNIANKLRKYSPNNDMGEIIKVFMLTASGSEGINLKNTRYVHIVESYWHAVRIEQVIGRARRICSHASLPKKYQTVEVFVYLMKFTPQQLTSEDALELNKHDLSKFEPKVPITSDQFLFQISEIKAKLTAQLADLVKETAFDCYLYSKDSKCMNFGNVNNSRYSYIPDYSLQQNDAIVAANTKLIEWEGVPVSILGTEYIARVIDPNTYYLYDKTSYMNALKNPQVEPLHIKTLIKKNGSYHLLNV